MKRLLSIDYIKVIAISLVVIGHCHYGRGNIYLSSIICMCVPLFFALNGSLLLAKERTYEYYIPKLFKILVLILFWGLASNWVASWVNGEHYTIKQSVFDLINLRLGYCNHLWFLFTLFILYLIYPLVQTLVEKKQTMWLSLVVICIFTLTSGVSRYIYQFNPLSGWHSYALAYALGGFAITKLNLRSKWYPAVTFVLALVAQIIYNYFLDDKSTMHFDGIKTPFVYVETLSFIKFFSMIKLNSNKVIDLIARNTLGIYLIHWFFTLYISQHEYTSSFRHFLPIGIIIISCAICWLMNKNKYTKWLISI